MTFRFGTRRCTAIAALLGYALLGSGVLRAPDADSRPAAPIAARTLPAACCCGPGHHAGDGCCCTSDCSTTDGPCVSSGQSSNGEQVAGPLQPLRLAPHDAGATGATDSSPSLMTETALVDGLPASVPVPPLDKVPLRAFRA
ncbi:MAG: hypothetical protein HYY18_07600 [Planctomycetes bacterium]|nr:hypothetical protein [Planctomycetota bacterium]